MSSSPHVSPCNNGFGCPPVLTLATNFGLLVTLVLSTFPSPLDWSVSSGILYGHPNCFLQLLLSSGLEYSLFSLMPIQIPCLITSWLEPPLTSSTLPYPPSALAACWSGLKTLGNEVPLSETFVHVDLYAT